MGKSKPCECTTGSPGMYEGPSRHCPIHGAEANAKTPKDQLLADLMQGVLHNSRNAALGHLAADADTVMTGAHDRVRGLFHVAATDESGATYLALRSAPGIDESIDFSALWTKSLEDPQHKRTVEEVLELPPIGDRISDMYPGVKLTSEPMPDGTKSLHGSYTLYARGDVAVKSLLNMLRTACERIPVPNWKEQGDG
jgi:hypothetical protein